MEVLGLTIRVGAMWRVQLRVETHPHIVTPSYNHERTPGTVLLLEAFRVRQAVDRETTAKYLNMNAI